ncbi:sodium:proton exchanger [bacterium]|nr:sodium:proton exchanger [bacterium]NDC94605.1 sodium:proton exchanger [bacterium]NDD84490.1 sodium:proton exchanger [bacterium]NDG30104.1 sodium:proton exchanger [bacterium]
MHDIFTELSLIIAIGTVISLGMRLLKQPLIIGHIVTGIIVGPSVLGIIGSAETIEVFSKIGITLLLFIIGLGLNPRVIKEVGKVATIAGGLQIFFTILFGWAAAYILGFSKTESILLAIALSFSSTIIILKLLSDKKEQTRLYGKVTIGILLIQDIVATIVLLLLTSQNGQDGFSPVKIALLGAKGIAIAAPLFFIGYKILPKMHKLIAGSQEFLFLFAIGWGFGVAALFQAAGFTVEIGALLAGVCLAGLPYTQEISSRLRPLRDFFVVVFFINLGAQLGFGNIVVVLPAVLVSVVIVVLIKPLIVMMSMGLLGYTKRTSFKSAITLAQISEFSLVVGTISLQSGKVSKDFMSILTLTALITIAVSTYLIMYADRIYATFEKNLSLFERAKARYEQKESRRHYEMVLFGYQRGGHEFVKVFKSLKKRFVVIDYDPDVVDKLEHEHIDYLYGDATDVELLEEVGLDKSKMVVSTITDHETNKFLVSLIEKINSHAVIITHADTVDQAAELYELGASYVMMPHYIGSEKIGAFIKKSGFKKSEFRKFRDKHLAYLQSHYSYDKSSNQE